MRRRKAATDGRRLFVIFMVLIALAWDTRLFAFPVITQQPASQTVPLGTNVTFIAAAQQSGQPSPISFQWRRNGVDIPGAISTSANPPFSAFYTITNVQPTDAGTYSVVVFDAAGAVNSTNAVLLIANLQDAPVADSFDQRGFLPDLFSGSVRANNFNATSEPGEPNHDGIPGGASVWLKWNSPGPGIVRFDTRGSGFDTTLAVYTGDSLGKLTLVAGDDDEGGFLNSSVVFNATVGVEYEIAIDGFYGERGNIVLNWLVQQSSIPLPDIVTPPQSTTVPPGADLTLSVIVRTQPNDPPLNYQWFLNGASLNGPDGPSLSISNIQSSQVGDYRVAVRFALPGGGTGPPILSPIAHVQMNVPGNTKVAAQSKFRQSIDPASGPKSLGSNGGVRPKSAPVSGFTGTQIFNTFGAVKEPGEPNHCGEAGGASYWFSYLAAANGNLIVDANCAFNGILAIYTGPGDSFATLVPVSCSSSNSGVGHEVVTFPAGNGKVYYIVVDGVGGATGLVTLNYNLASPPMITLQPQSQTVPQGSNVTLNAAAVGTPPLSYQWRTNNSQFPARTNTNVTITNFQSFNEGSYDVVVTNATGMATSSAAVLYLGTPLRFTNTFASSNGFATTLLGTANTNYIIQVSTNLGTTNWVSIATNASPYGIIPFLDTNWSAYSNRFFRALPK